MTGKSEVLFLAHRIPFPPDKGDKIRSWRLFKHLAGKFDVHLACFIDDPRDFAHRDYLESLCASTAFVPLRQNIARIKSLAGLISNDALTFGYYRDKKMAAAVNNIRARPLAAEIVYSSSMAPYIASPIAGRTRIIDFCDADSEKWRQYALDTDGLLGWVYAREGEALARSETQIANWADASFAVTNEEAMLFNQRPGSRNHVGWWSNGVDVEHFDPAHSVAPVEAACDVVFVGAMDYRANVDAVREFTSEVWPKIRAAAPGASFAVVGANPSAKIRALDGKNGVTVTGRVDDVRPWLTQAKIIVAPMRIARGLQNKVLEAMAMAKPVVGTTEAMIGINCDNAAARIADTTDDMAEAVIGLLEEPDRALLIGAAARIAVTKNHNWNVELRRFDSAIDGLLT